MYKGIAIMPKPARIIHEAVSKGVRVKGMGRRHPHSGVYTRKSSDTKHGIAISNGLNKINMFFSGQPFHKPVKPKVSTNPFTKMMNTILRRK